MSISLNEYQQEAMATRLPTADSMYALLGLSGEVGELHSLVAKAIRDDVKDNDIFDQLLKKELGDILWFVAAIAQDMVLTLEDVAKANLEKLKKRKQDNTIGGSGNDR